MKDGVTPVCHYFCDPKYTMYMMKSKRDKKAKKNKNKGEFESYEDIDWESLGNKKKNKKKKKHSGTKVVKVVHVR